MPCNSLDFVKRAPFFLVLLLTWMSSPISAAETKNPSITSKAAALSPPGGLDFLLAVHPAVGKTNQPRIIFLQFVVPGCSDQAVSLDTSLVESQGVLTIRTQDLPVFCPLQPPPRTVRFDLTFTPSKVGTLRLRWDRGSADVIIQSNAENVSSKFDTNGMWFDAVTNGSGIAVHHRRSASDVAFGTWFLFNNNGEPRWYTLQSANWQQDGSVLEGLLIQVVGRCTTAGLAGCPASGAIAFGPSPATSFGVIPSLVRLSFQSATRVRADVWTLGGTMLFTSELTKLQF